MRTVNDYRQLFIVLISVVLLSACGGGGSSTSTTATGVIIDSPVGGLEYMTSSGTTGITNASGEFTYQTGDMVTFMIGGTTLGNNPGQAIITLLDLFNTTNVADRRVVNLARLLLSLNTNATNDTIMLPGSLAGTNPTINLDQSPAAFSADTNIINLLASVSATLTTESDARAHLAVQLQAMNISFINTDTPVASAGPDQVVDEQTTVTLSGANSTDSDGTIASYAWVETTSNGAQLSNANTATPSFTAPTLTAATTLTFQLTVTDNAGATNTDSVSITVNPVNASPTANAGPDQVVNEGVRVALTGAGSSDSDGQVSRYQWTETTNSGVVIANANTATPSFVAPTLSTATTLTVQLTVTDNEGGTATDSVSITVNPVNANPIANAGPDQTTNVQTQSVTLTGVASSDGDGSIPASGYAWVQTSGSSVTLTNAGTISPSFAPTALTITTPTTLSFQLTVTDNEGGTVTDSVNVIVNPSNTPPTANAGEDQAVNGSITVTLNGTASSDSDGVITSYQWSQLSGDSVTLSSNPASGSAGFTAPMVTTPTVLNFQLTVTDNQQASASDSVSITVNPPQSSGFSLGGTVTAAVNTAVDGDVNDPFATLVANNTMATAQSVPAPLQLNGYVTRFATSRADDRFRSQSDINDYYTATLLAGQFVSLRVVDFNAANSTSVDIDLTLFNSAGNVVAQSSTNTQFESVRVSASGTYTIRVQSIRGRSKYVLSIGSQSLAPAPVAAGGSMDFIPGESIVKFNNPVAAKTLTGQGIATFSNEQTTDAVLMRAPPAGMQSMLATLGGTPLNISGLSAAALSPENRTKMETLNMIKTLNQRDDVEYAEPNYRRYPLLTPNDQFYNLQWHYPQINLPQAWDITTGTPVSGSVIVAVVDTGVVLNHQDFAGKLVAGYDFISSATSARDGDGIDNNPDDPGDNSNLSLASWHGTHVSGTVGAASNNTIGVAGVSWGAQIMPIRALGSGGGTSFDVDQGVRYAAGLSNSSNTLPPRRADIINLSLGGGGFSQTEQNTFDQVRAAGVLVAAAAGNENTSTLSYPASYNGVISVAATDLRNNRAPYSNFGTTVDVAAPGGNTSIDTDGNGFPDGVLSTLVNGQTGTLQDTYRFYQGTSMSSPHMAGVLALMKAVHPSLTPAEVDAALANGSITTDLGATGRDDIFGHGLINALSAVQVAQQLAGGTGTIPGNILVSPSRFDFGRTNTSTNITVSQVGNSPPTITGVTDNATFLTVDASAANAQGIGTYRLNVNRTGLAVGLHNAQVTFTTSNNVNLTVDVTVEVGTALTGTGDTGVLYFLLLDERNLPVDEVRSSVNSDGTYTYQFNNLSAGNYRVVAGSDVDNDLFICDIGETCGGFPTLNELQSLALNSNRNDVNFGSAVLNGVNVSTATQVFAASPVKQLTGNGRRQVHRQ